MRHKRRPCGVDNAGMHSGARNAKPKRCLRCAPMVGCIVESHFPAVNLCSKQLLPTARLPAMMTCTADTAQCSLARCSAALVHVRGQPVRLTLKSAAGGGGASTESPNLSDSSAWALRTVLSEQPMIRNRTGRRRRCLNSMRLSRKDGGPWTGWIGWHSGLGHVAVVSCLIETS